MRGQKGDEQCPDVLVVRTSGPSLDEESLHRMLEFSDRALRVGEGGLEMGEDMGGRLACGFRIRPGRRLGRWRASTQGGADLALGPVEPLPDTLPGPNTALAADGVAGGQDTGGDGNLEEMPQSVGGNAEASEVVGEPDAEGPAATGTCLAVAAKDAPCAQYFSPGVALVGSGETAVSNQCADHLAVRAGHVLEPLCNGRPFVVVAVEPDLLSQGMPPRKSSLYRHGEGRGNGEVR